MRIVFFREIGCDSEKNNDDGITKRIVKRNENDSVFAERTNFPKDLEKTIVY